MKLKQRCLFLGAELKVMYGILLQSVIFICTLQRVIMHIIMDTCLLVV